MVISTVGKIIQDEEHHSIERRVAMVCQVAREELTDKVVFEQGVSLKDMWKKVFASLLFNQQCKPLVTSSIHFPLSLLIEPLDFT